MICRWAIVATGLLALSGCGDPVAPAAGMQGLVVERWTGGSVQLPLRGTIVHPGPQPIAQKQPWLPLKQLADDGTRVAAGDPVATVDAEVIERFASNDRLMLQEQIARAAQDDLRNRRRLADLEQRRADLQATIGVLEAEIAALTVRDADEISIARRELDDARRDAQRAIEALERTRALRQAGFASAAAVATAENTAALRRASVAVPEYRLLVLEEGSTALTRRQKQLERDRQVAQLTGLSAQIAALEEAAGRSARNASRDLRKVDMQVERWQGILDDPALRSQVDGVVQLRDSSITVGSKPPMAPFAYVMDDVGLMVEILVPDRLRSCVAVGAQATVRVPALDVRGSGTVATIAAVPEELPDGSGRAFRCRVALLAPMPGLRPGMVADCDVAVDPQRGEPLAVVPVWIISDRRSPTVQLADGERRPIDAVIVGRQAVVFAGLSPGDVLALSDAPPAGGLRITGILAPQSFLPLRVTPTQQRWDGGWELTEMVPDGSYVRAGEVVARLAKAGWGGDPRDSRLDAEMAEFAAAARLAQARADAAAGLADALAAWRSATLAAERARLDLHIATLEGSDSRQVAAAAAVVRAQVALRRARTAADELTAPGAESAYSADDANRRRSELRRAELALRRAQLEALASRRQADHAAITSARAAVVDAESELDARRNDYLIARLNGQQQIAAAQLAWRDEYARQSGNRLMAAGETMIAPRDGQIFHRADAQGKALRLGDNISGREVFIMPLDDRRTLEIEVPARFYARFTPGATVPVQVPALGPQPRAATVIAVGAYFSDPSGTREERATHGSVGVPERVFRLQLGLDLSADEARRAPPGSAAYVDF